MTNRLAGRLVSVVLAALFAAPLIGEQATVAQETGMSIYDVALTRAVTSAQISPDGRQVVYVLSVPRDPKSDESGGNWAQLHVVDRAGNSRPFVSGEVNVSGVQWSPSGEGISFLSKRGDDKNTCLYYMPFSGGEPQKLAELETSISGYAWRPDGQRVALLAKEPAEDWIEENEKQGFNAEIYEEDFRFTQIWTVDGDLDTDDQPELLPVEGECSEIEYGPDGRRLVVAVSEKPLIDYFYMFRKIKIVNAGHGDVEAVINNPGKIGPIRWSPDGRRIAFCSGEDINDPSEGRLMVADASGGEPRQVMADYLPNITGIEWKDSNTVFFSTEDGCLSGYGEVDVNNGSRKMLIEPGGPIITAFSVSEDKSMSCLIANSPNFPNEAFVFNHFERPDRLTVSNEWLDDRRMAQQEIIEYRSSVDGERIEGVLVRPLDEVEGQSYPLIVTVHGGPEASIANGWVTGYSNPGQVAAAKGFAVFYPNYRGSTGRGVPFAKAHQSDYGGKEFDDIVDGVDYLIESGLVDRDRVGITGGSYGGFATAWCCTKHSERFAAGVMFVGISNQISKSGTTDIPEEMFLVHARKRIWEDWQFFLERSPIYYVEKCRTPLLIMHGKNDTRVDPSQSMELYRNLKILDQAPVRLVLYPGEGHGNRKSGAKFDYNMRMLRWMENFLLNGERGIPPHLLDYDLELGMED